MIIGISGLANAGKDTAADILVEHRRCVKVSFADPLKRICQDVFSFSNDQLWGPSENRNAPDHRYLVSEGYAEAYEKTKEENPELAASYARQGWLTPRVALQLLGTEWGRRCYDSIWVDYALRIAQNLHSEDIVIRPTYSPARGLDYTDCNAAGRKAGNGGKVDGVVIPDVRFKNEVKGIKAAGGKVIRIYRPGAGLKGLAAQHLSETEQTEIPDELFDCRIYNVGSLEALKQCVLRAWTGLQTGTWPEPGELEKQTGDGITARMLRYGTDS